MQTRSRRRRGKPARLQTLGSFRDPFAPATGDWLNRNPNKVKHGAAALDHDPATEARIHEAETADSPVDVKEWRRRDSIGRQIYLTPRRRGHKPTTHYTAQRSDFDGKRYQRPAA